MKKELIISVIAIVAFLAISLNVCVFAAEGTGFNNLVVGNNITAVNNVVTGNNSQIEIVNNTNVSNESVNEPDKLANTGLADLPLVVIAICAVTAIFAFAKIKEYKAY